MPPPSEPLEKLGFLTIGSFDGADPGPGHETTLEVIELGEQLGFDSAWVRHRHLQYGISSPVAVLAAARSGPGASRWAPRSSRSGWENPLRLAEDLATVDILSGGRLNPGISVGPPMRCDDVRDALYPDTADIEDFSYERVLRLLRFVAGEQASPFRGTVGIEEFSDRIEPHSPGLRDRMWYGGASVRSAQWAGEHGMNFLTSNVLRAEETEDFAEIQRSHIETFRAHHPDGAAARVSQGLVVIPTDSATPEQRAKYAAYVEARTPRTATPQGPARMMFARDLVGTADEIAETLYAHAGVPAGPGGRVRAAVQLRPRRLRADPDRHRDEAGPGAGLAADGLTDPAPAPAVAPPAASSHVQTNRHTPPNMRADPPALRRPGTLCDAPDGVRQRGSGVPPRTAGTGGASR